MGTDKPAVNRSGRSGGMEGVVALLQEAAFDEEGWTPVATAIDDACGSYASHLVVLSDKGERCPFRFSRFLIGGEPDDETERLFNEEYAPRDERLPRLPGLRYAHLIHNTEIYTDQEQRLSPVYAGFLPRYGTNNQVNVRLAGRNDSDIVWVLTRKTASDWMSENLAFLEGLLPHVAHFVRVRQALAEADAREASLTELIERAGLGVAFLDAWGRLLEVNAPGRRLLAEGHCLSERDGRLRARWPSDDAKLGRLLRACCRDGVGGSMTVQPSADDAIAGPVTLHACPVPPDLRSWDARGVAAKVLLTEPHAGGPIDPGPIAAAHGLTRTEAKVAALLAEGRTVSEIVASTGRKESTVRWHVRNLHSKLGVHRQADLVRLVLSTAAAAPTE